MTNDEMQDLAEEAIEIYEQGIEVHMRSTDKVQLFTAIVAANTVTYLVITGFKKFMDKRASKRRIASLKVHNLDK